MTFSAGILPYRFVDNELQVMLVHPGGPYFSNKDLHSWSISKGIVEENEGVFEAALREFKEETGFDIQIKNNNFLDLNIIKQTNNKIVKIWAIEKDFDVSKLKSNTFDLEYPKGNEIRKFPEVDKAEWFSIPIAREKISCKQISFLRRLIIKLDKLKRKNKNE